MAVESARRAASRCQEVETGTETDDGGRMGGAGAGRCATAAMKYQAPSLRRREPYTAPRAGVSASPGEASTPPAAGGSRAASASRLPPH